ncbi:MAG: ferrochelatase [Actinobacteria bacterium]|nr:ferrochelatase [Actinomycetota bacterium]MCA1722124.1 ferrochelatase [Actinomycetota bacterium]
MDALLLVSFGGPEKPADVVPFLENVTRGRGIPAERLAEVGRHYLDVFGGVSPINEQCRELVAALEAAQDRPVYWGNRNWHPFLTDTLAQMRTDGVEHAYAIVTSAFPSYSGCRQYREDVERGQLHGAPRVTKIRHYYCEDGFVRPLARNVQAQLEGMTAPRLVFTAHSIPLVMAETSGPSGGAYVEALRTACGLVAGDRPWDLVFQSRSGPPQVPWLEPDVGDHLARLHAEGVREAVLVPIGFTSDHVEVVYDLDVQAQERVGQLPGMTVRRAATVGTDPEFVQMLVDLVAERAAGPELDSHGCVATHDRCPVGCCPPPPRRS